MWCHICDVRHIWCHICNVTYVTYTSYMWRHICDMLHPRFKYLWVMRISHVIHEWVTLGWVLSPMNRSCEWVISCTNESILDESFHICMRNMDESCHTWLSWYDSFTWLTHMWPTPSKTALFYARYNCGAPVREMTRNCLFLSFCRLIGLFRLSVCGMLCQTSGVEREASTWMHCNAQRCTTAAHCNALQHTEMYHCNTPYCTATQRGVPLQHTGMHSLLLFQLHPFAKSRTFSRVWSLCEVGLSYMYVGMYIYVGRYIYVGGYIYGGGYIYIGR